MQVEVSYTGTPYQLKTTARGIVVESDAVDSAKNGTDTRQNPHEKFLGSLGECTAMTILMYANRKTWKVDELTIKVVEDKIEDPNQPGSGVKIPHITLTVEIKAETLSDEQLAKLQEIGDKCPVKKLVTEAKVIDLTVARPAK